MTAQPSIQNPKTHHQNSATGLKFAIILATVIVCMAGQLSFWLFDTTSWATFWQQPMQDNSPIYWQLSRVFGVVAYVLFWLSVMTGLMISTKNANTWFSRGSALSWHQFFSSFALMMAMGHVAWLYFDNYLNPTLAELLIPWMLAQLGVTKMAFIAAGQMAVYLMAMIIMGHHAKKYLSQNAWRYLHAFALIAYIAMVVHGLYVGTDSGELWLLWLYLFTNAILGVVVIYRIIELKRGA